MADGHWCRQKTKTVQREEGQGLEGVGDAKIPIRDPDKSQEAEGEDPKNFREKREREDPNTKIIQTAVGWSGTANSSVAGCPSRTLD